MSTEQAFLLRPDLTKPIPLNISSVSGYKEIPIKESGEPLVALGPFSEYRDIYTDAIYAGERTSSPYINNPIDGSLLTMFVRESVAIQLRKAQLSLPKGYHLVVNDAFRTVETQQSLFDRYIKALRNKRPDLTESERIDWTTDYVSQPSLDPEKPSTHNTGGSVDVVICSLPSKIETDLAKLEKEQKTFQWEVTRTNLISTFAKQLTFPTNFDYGQEEAALLYLENKSKKSILSKSETEALNNVRILYNLMTSFGFQPLSSEWWHFNSLKTQMGAKLSGLSFVEFGPAKLSEENKDHEKMRKDCLLVADNWSQTSMPLAEVILP